MALPVVQNMPLPELDDADPVPSVSLHVLAKNAESVIGRLIDNIGPYVQEMRFILNDTTDHSRRVVERKLGEWPRPMSFDIQEITAENHPELYFLDEVSSYRVGKSLSDEQFEGPCTGKPLLCDWAAIRNLGWESSCDWRLFLDVDDVVEDPRRLPALVTMLDRQRVDLAATRYVFGRNDAGVANSVSYRERLAKNLPAIRWEGSTHEILVGGLRRVLIEDCFQVVDLKDNWGKGTRVPGRCFKVLYREARMAGWDTVTPRHLAYLVQESPKMMPLVWVTGVLLPFYLARCVHGEEAAWVLSMVAEMHEQAGELLKAEKLLVDALKHYMASKAAFRLCRVRFLLNDWQGCIEAYKMGLLYQSSAQVLDMGPVYVHSSKLLVAQSYFELGDMAMARETIDEAVTALGDTATPIVRELQAAIHSG
jgi:hypothetical protein